ncbi:GMC family oxidoreductase N-terminal domain-containing protein [Aquabacter sp. CN5-332]|uniref:GMC family oxidoreductase n=1 Tax=Aquabacter sp. CN5-332 TaxID=3156608 RepID=UPI0032B4377D
MRNPEAVPTYDYIIVGAGSAGCVLADRLTESGKRRVLLLEAGGSDARLNIRIPLFVAKILNDPQVTWPFRSVPQAHLGGRDQLLVRGKVLGGSSSVNGNVFVRGDPAEYDDWEAAGCQGWGYRDLVPYFKRSEHFPEGDPDARGREGPVSVTKLRKFDDLAEAYLRSCEEIGVPGVEDYNDGTYAGASYLQYSTRRGFRCSTAVAYLGRARKRHNLKIATGARATRVLMEDKRAVGVEYVRDGMRQTARARAEVILSAGPMQSPQILELSGIGNPEVLARHGIPVVHALPAVGENLHDHPNTRVAFECARPLTINDILRSPVRQVQEGLKFAVFGGGMLSICSATAQAILKSGVHPSKADLKLQLHPLSGKDRYARTPEAGLDPFSGFTIGITALQARSRGAVHIGSPDPLADPEIDPNYLSDPADLATLLAGLRISRRLAAAPTLGALVVREVRPGPDLQDEAGLVDYVRATTQTTWHFVGSCRMGADPDAVVDSELRVRGVEGLRVIDSSIFPTIPSSNTNAPTIATGEKGADLLMRGDNQLRH